MRPRSIILSAALLATAFIATESSAQGIIRIGDLRKLTAPLSGPAESYAIGYDGDTTESEEATSLYSLNANFVKREAIRATQQPAASNAGKPDYSDCIECTLREEGMLAVGRELYAREFGY